MKKICVISGTRADYGLLYWTMKEIQNSAEFELQIIATCMHLNPKFGKTWEQFEKDGFEISKKVDLGDQVDSNDSVINQISQGVIGFNNAYKELNPDLVLILGDRYEMLAAAQAAVFNDVPIAHIHGGEVTEGAFDDMIRHSITKMSTYHFTSTDTYKNRVIQMGEDPARVLNVGAVGLENIRKLDLLKKEDMEIPFKVQNFLITYHPVTAQNENGVEPLLDVLSKYPDTCQIITMPNSDPGHAEIFKRLEEYAKRNKNVYLSTSLGFLKYLSCMQICDAVIGNSSSGIIEAPFFGTPTLNIGVRQKGRLRADSVVDCGLGDIEEKLNELLSRSYSKSLIHGDGHCAHQIISFLAKQDFKVKSGFYDG
jgi:GDP/UDP-N,N'-diacetylbacillosamine 2-epimerase (hydrolysing)